LVKAIYRELGVISLNIDLLCRTMETIVLQNDLLRYENIQLNSTLLQEAGRHKRGKALGLLDKEEPKFGQFWSLVKLAIRKEVIKTKEEQERSRKQLLEEKK
jgi:hypothetical protein